MVIRYNFYCLKEEDLLIYGSYSSFRGRIINILVNKCKDEKYCLSDKEINKWFNIKYLLLRINRVRFDAKQRGDDSFVYESIDEWIPIMT